MNPDRRDGAVSKSNRRASVRKDLWGNLQRSRPLDSPLDGARSSLVVIWQPLSPRLQFVILFKRDIRLLDRPRHSRPNQATSPESGSVGARFLDVRDRPIHADEEGPLGALMPSQFGQLSWGEIGIKVGRIRHAVCLIQEQSNGKDGGER